MDKNIIQNKNRKVHIFNEVVYDGGKTTEENLIKITERLGEVCRENTQKTGREETHLLWCYINTPWWKFKTKKRVRRELFNTRPEVIMELIKQYSPRVDSLRALKKYVERRIEKESDKSSLEYIKKELKQYEK